MGLILLVICIDPLCAICYKADLHGSGNARELTVTCKSKLAVWIDKAVFALERQNRFISTNCLEKVWG